MGFLPWYQLVGAGSPKAYAMRFTSLTELCENLEPNRTY
jgi:hypothetical protein